jgi:tetratricopeptide (TPR) repeat protein
MTAEAVAKLTSWKMGKLAQTVSALNDADELREQIDNCEKSLALLNAESARKLMLDANTAHQMMQTLLAAGADLRGEVARLQSVDERIIRNARPIVKLLGGRQALIDLRTQTAPGTHEPWWMLDAELDRRRQKLLKRLGVIAGIIVGILIIGYIARPILFPPDPVGDAIADATNALYKQDMVGVQSAIDAGLAQVPTSTELLIWKGYLYEQAGDKASADAAYAEALKSAGSEKDYLLQRSMDFVRLGDYAQVVTDTTKLIEMSPDSAEAYYMRASGYEGLNQRQQAMADLEKCGELAQAAGNDSLYAQSRVRLATLMQSGAQYQ